MDLRCAFRNFTGFRFRGGLYGIYLFRSMGLIYKEVWEIIWILYGMLYVIYVIVFSQPYSAPTSPDGLNAGRWRNQGIRWACLKRSTHSSCIHTIIIGMFVKIMISENLLVDKPCRVMQPVLPRFSDSFFSSQLLKQNVVRKTLVSWGRRCYFWGCVQVVWLVCSCDIH